MVVDIEERISDRNSLIRVNQSSRESHVQKKSRAREAMKSNKRES